MVIIDFGDLDLIFKVTQALWNVQNMVSMCYLLSHSMDFGQTGIDTLLGEGELLIRFWWPWLNFWDHTSTLKCHILTKIVFLYDISLFEQSILAKLNVMYHCDKM